MKKNVVSTIRMSERVRNALKLAAEKDHRTVSSLLDKIITDYLKKKGFIGNHEIGLERRRFPRKKITLPAKTFLKSGEDQTFPTVILDISMGGALVTYPKKSEIKSMGALPRFKLCLDLPRGDETLCFDCETRRMRDTGNEIQFGTTFDNPEKTSLKKLGNYLM